MEALMKAILKAAAGTLPASGIIAGAVAPADAAHG